MFIEPREGAAASTDHAGTPPNPPSASSPQEEHPKEQTRHLIFGTPTGVQSNIKDLHAIGYAEPNDWSRALETGRPGEVMVILTRRV